MSIRRLVLAAVVVVGLIFLGDATTMRIDAAHVGIRVKLAGNSRGVQDIPIVSGGVFFNPLTEQVISFPTSVQNPRRNDFLFLVLQNKKCVSPLARLPNS